MNKRIICLLLSAIMLLSVALTGCSKKTDDEALENVTEAASESTMTLTMYLMSESEVSDDQAAKIEEAVNKITKSKFKTRIILKYFTEEEYTEALETAFNNAALEADDYYDSDDEAATGTTVEETIINELGVTELKYPTVSENQVDIFYLGGYDKFNEYLNNGWLMPLDENLSTDAKTLNTYIFGNYFKNIEYNTNGTYIIPNNVVAGEYTYMLLHKEALETYHYSASNNFTSLVCENTQDLLSKVATYSRDSYVPLWSGTGELDVANIGYIGIDYDKNGNPYYTNEFSLLGGTTLKPGTSIPKVFAAENEYIPYENVVDSQSFKDQLKTLVTYKENGYYAKEDETDKPFAVGYVKGTPMDVLQYADEYEIITVEKPQMTTANAYDHAFAVSSNTSSTTRSMKIITYLNTNETFRNLILYGIEGENYEIVEQEAPNLQGVMTKYKTVRKLNNDYNMAVEKTGNVILAYPLETELPNIREYQKLQNSEAVTALDFGFSFSYSDYPLNTNAILELREFTNQIYEELLALDSIEDYNRFYYGGMNGDTKVEAFISRVYDNDYIHTSLNTEYDESMDEIEPLDPDEFGYCVSLAYVYFHWLDDKGIYVKVEP